jgi:hypothetical protein
MENKTSINVITTTKQNHPQPGGEGASPAPLSSAYTSPGQRKMLHKLLQNTMATFEKGLKDLGETK